MKVNANVVHPKYEQRISATELEWISTSALVKIAAILVAILLVCLLVREILRYWSITNLIDHARLTFVNYLFHDRTDIQIQFLNSQGYGMNVYLGTVVTPVESIEVEGQFMENDVNLDTNCLFDYLNVTWDTIAVSLPDLDIKFPNSFPIPLIHKFQIRKLFQDKTTRYRLIAHNAYSTRSRPLTSMYDLQEVTLRRVDTSLTDRSYYNFESLQLRSASEQDVKTTRTPKDNLKTLSLPVRAKTLVTCLEDLTPDTSVYKHCFTAEE